MVHELAAIGAATCWASAGIIAAGPATHFGALAFNRWRQVFATWLFAVYVLATGTWRELDGANVPLLIRPRRAGGRRAPARGQGAHRMTETHRNPVHIRPEQVAAEVAALGEKIARGTEVFNQTRDNDVSITTTLKDEIWRQDKVTLHHYRPLTKARVRVPVLIVYGLIGHYTMADLQEDRSLVRNLLNLAQSRGTGRQRSASHRARLLSSRAQKWALAQAFMPTWHGDKVAKKRVISERRDFLRT